MSVAPAVLTDPILTTREAQPVVLVTSEEILTVRTPAYSKSQSDLSFLVRQPSGSAICSSYVELILTLKFILRQRNNGETQPMGLNVVRTTFTGTHNTINLRYKQENTAAGTDLEGDGSNAQKLAGIRKNASDYGFMPELLPIQNKCVRNAVLTINGSSQSMRMNEFGKEYNLLHLDRPYANKIGGGINDYCKQKIYRTDSATFGNNVISGQFGPPGVISQGEPNSAYNGFGGTYADNRQRQMQVDEWKERVLQDKRFNKVEVENALSKWQIREPLFIGPFSAFQGADAFPAWSCEGQKSPGLLHVHSLQLQLAMEDNWWRSIWLQTCAMSPGLTHTGEVAGVEIESAELQTKWYMPPPRLVSAALTQTVSYATYDVLRFIANFQRSDSNTGLVHDGQNCSFKLNAVSFPYMPSLFVFSIKPHYGFATAFIGNQQTRTSMIDAMKGDKRMAIHTIDLVINTSSAGIPHKGGSNTDAENFVKRLNARELYKMTLENCANMTKFPYTFEEWYRHCGFVAISPAQLSGTLNSPNVRGTVVLSGTIHGRNMMGFPCNVTNNSINLDNNIAANGVVYPNDTELPRYQCFISGFYSNRSLVLDAKSGIVNENTFSSSFQQSLRLGSSQMA